MSETVKSEERSSFGNVGNEANSINEVQGEIHNIIPSISHRNDPGFVEDRDMWMDLRRTEHERKVLNKFVLKMQRDILRDKPDDIVRYMNEEFFSLENHLRLVRFLGLKH